MAFLLHGPCPCLVITVSGRALCLQVIYLLPKQRSVGEESEDEPTAEGALVSGGPKQHMSTEASRRVQPRLGSGAAW